jgi:hypothetical protein
LFLFLLFLPTAPPIWVPDCITKIFEFVRISLGNFDRNLHNMSKTATNNKNTVYENAAILVRKMESLYDRNFPKNSCCVENRLKNILGRRHTISKLSM